MNVISINPPHSTRIITGTKTVEWRKTRIPAERSLLYETKNGGGAGAIIGKFDIVTQTQYRSVDDIPDSVIAAGCVNREDLACYAGKKPLWAHFLSNVQAYETPRSLAAVGLSHAPMSYVSTEVLNDNL